MNLYALNNAFYTRQMINPLSSGQIALWHALTHIANKTGWKPWFTVAGITLVQLTGLSYQGIAKARNQLKQYGLIDFKSNGTKACAYTIIDITALPQPESVPEPVEEDDYGNPMPDAEWLRVQDHYQRNLSTQFPQGVREDDLWHFYETLGADVMCFAIEVTARSAGDSRTAYNYLAKILAEWQKANVHTLDDAKIQHAQHQRATQKPPEPTPVPPAPKRREIY